MSIRHLELLLSLATAASLAALLSNSCHQIGANVKHAETVFSYAVASGWRAYGPAINADGLANTQVGGSDCVCPAPGTRVSYRFRATSELLESIRIFVQDGAGYGAGTGGKIRLDLQTDDGQSQHAPGGSILATKIFRPGNPVAEHFPLIRFDLAVPLAPGNLYHIVFTNEDARPASNFQSVNALFVAQPGKQTQPRYSDVDWAQLIDVGKGWTTRRGYAPILELNYRDRTEGIGYIEVWSRSPKLVTYRSAVRESFCPSGTARTVDTLFLRIANSGGTGSLRAVLEQADGTLLGQSSVSAKTIPVSQSWVRFDFRERPVLSPGTSYRLVFSATGSASFAAFPIRRGLSYGFSRSSFFSEGYAEFQDGSKWLDWESPTRGGAKEADLQFYFTLSAEPRGDWHSVPELKPPRIETER